MLKIFPIRLASHNNKRNSITIVSVLKWVKWCDVVQFFLVILSSYFQHDVTKQYIFISKFNVAENSPPHIPAACLSSSLPSHPRKINISFTLLVLIFLRLWPGTMTSVHVDVLYPALATNRPSFGLRPSGTHFRWMREMFFSSALQQAWPHVHSLFCPTLGEKKKWMSSFLLLLHDTVAAWTKRLNLVWSRNKPLLI